MTITQKEYQNLLTILNSSDEENKIVGLTTLENLKYEANEIYIMLLLKHSSLSAKLIEEHAPSLVKLHSDLITYNSIWVKMKKKNMKKIVNKEIVEFFLQDWLNFMKDSLKSAGYDFIEDLNIKIEINGELK